jgi:PKD repeat protein
MFSITRRIPTALVLTPLVTTIAAGCSVSKQEAPALSGPSEFGTSIVLSASPELLVQDGVSQSVITATARDTAGRPVAGLGIHWGATASSTRDLPGTLSTTSSVTDSGGRATMVLTAPPVPTEAPNPPAQIVVLATPVEGSATDAVARTVVIRLQPPAGVLPANNLPVARFTVSPKVGIVDEPVTFDASTTTDDGEPCLSRCTYMWDFGDGISASGISVSHVYRGPDTTGYTVTLTVKDERNGIASSTATVPVSATTVIARFTVTPASPEAGAVAMFDASGSTAGSGNAISRYEWDFGDSGGVPVSTTTPTIGHTYDESRVYTVRLTITAVDGQSFTTAQTITVR